MSTECENIHGPHKFSPVKWKAFTNQVEKNYLLCGYKLASILGH